MRTLLIAALSAAAVLVTAAVADAGHFCKKHYKVDCDACAATCGESCNPCDYRCKRTDKLEPIEKDCALIKEEAICIPPITTSPFDCFRKKKCSGCGLLSCKGCGGCDGCPTVPEACDTCCDSSCDGSCGSKKGGLFSCFGTGCGKIRCVKKLDSDSYECGQKCVTKWEAVRVDCCGELPAIDDDEIALVEPIDLPTPEESAAMRSVKPVPPIEMIEDEEFENAPPPPQEPVAAPATASIRYLGGRKRN